MSGKNRKTKNLAENLTHDLCHMVSYNYHQHQKINNYLIKKYQKAQIVTVCMVASQWCPKPTFLL